ncbi:hypothetical protein BN126380011 [Stenotrophomonas maltophilia]|nr:hypothetical protein BN126380011 [Stenotrophomonas maltophilia]
MHACASTRPCRWCARRYYRRWGATSTHVMLLPKPPDSARTRRSGACCANGPDCRPRSDCDERSTCRQAPERLCFAPSGRISVRIPCVLTEERLDVFKDEERIARFCAPACLCPVPGRVADGRAGG